MAVGGIVSALIPFAFDHLPDMFSLFNLGNSFKSIIDGSTTNEKILEGVKELAPKFIPMLEKIGESMFPKAAPAMRVVAALIGGFDKDKTRWLQQSVNTLLPDEDDITVDGIYGGQTRAAVEKVQKLLGLDVIDGFAGKITRLAIDGALNVIFANQNKTQSVGITPTVVKAIQKADVSLPKNVDKSVGADILLSPAIMDEVQPVRAGAIR